MSPELLFTLKHTLTLEEFNINKTNIFSLGIILI